MVTTDTQIITPPPAEKPAGPIENAVPRNRFRIPGDQVRAAIQDLSREQQATVWWFYQFCHRSILRREDFGRLLKKNDGTWYSDSSIIHLLTGGRIRRGENIQPILEAIEKFRYVEELRAGQVNSGFIETRLFREIERRCRKALKRQRILFIYGDSQIGKSASLREYQRRNNHGQTIYIECPCTGSLGGLLRQFADAFNIPSVLNQGQLQDRVAGCIDSNMLIIIDEFHNALKGRGIATTAFVREIWNRSRCGMILSMTNEGRDSFLMGSQSKTLQQLWRRRITPLQLPGMPPDDDLELFAGAYGLPPADADPVTISVTSTDQQGRHVKATHTEKPIDLQTRIVGSEGLGVWIGILQDAADMAQEQRKPITWGAVIKAACQSRAEAEIFI